MNAVFAVCAVLLAVASNGFAQSHPDFSGTWKMDPARSESAHQEAPIGPVSLAIQQTASQVRVETRRRDLHSAAVSTETLTFSLDGTEAANPGTSGTPVKVKGHWDGSQLVVETEREVNGSTITTHQVFQLGARGKEITIQKTLTVQHGYQGSAAERATGTGKDVFVKTADATNSAKP